MRSACLRAWGCVLLALIFLTQCADDGEAPAPQGIARCEINQMRLGSVYRYCVEYRNIATDKTESIKKICTSDSGGAWFANSLCSTGDLKGKCHFSSGATPFTFFYYSSFDENSALQNCMQAGGSWEHA